MLLAVDFYKDFVDVEGIAVTTVCAFASKSEPKTAYIGIPNCPGYRRQAVSQYCSEPHQVGSIFKCKNWVNIRCKSTHVTFTVRRITGTTDLQIPIAHSTLINRCCCDPAVSSPEYYPTPASNADVIRKPLLVGRHLIILNNNGLQKIDLACTYTAGHSPLVKKYQL
jgi:hypothetical protein